MLHEVSQEAEVACVSSLENRTAGLEDKHSGVEVRGRLRRLPRPGEPVRDLLAVARSVPGNGLAPDGGSRCQGDGRRSAGRVGSIRSGFSWHRSKPLSPVCRIDMRDRGIGVHSPALMGFNADSITFKQADQRSFSQNLCCAERKETHAWSSHLSREARFRISNFYTFLEIMSS